MGDASLLGSHVLTMRQFDRDLFEQIFDCCDTVAKMPSEDARAVLPGRILVSAFFQTSTRTRMAHESAMIRLGGNVTGFADLSVTRAGDFYAESLRDMAHMLSFYGDVIVIRHPATGAPAEFAHHASVPVINAGDGWGEHPTQAVVDLYTIRERFGTIDGLRIVLVGDLRMRTIRSLLLGLRHFDCAITWISPQEQMPDASLLAELKRSPIALVRVDDLRDAVSGADVVFMEPVVQPDYTLARQLPPAVKPGTDPRYRVDRALLQSAASSDLLVLHALPREDELDTDVDDTPFNGYWREAELGVTVRMALLNLLLKGRL